jgi:hypothetical protein
MEDKVRPTADYDRPVAYNPYPRRRADPNPVSNCSILITETRYARQQCPCFGGKAKGKKEKTKTLSVQQFLSHNLDAGCPPTDFTPSRDAKLCFLGARVRFDRPSPAPARRRPLFLSSRSPAPPTHRRILKILLLRPVAPRTGHSHPFPPLCPTPAHTATATASAAPGGGDET